MTNFIWRTFTCILQTFQFETNILKRELAIANYFESYFWSEYPRYNKSSNAKTHGMQIGSSNAHNNAKWSEKRKFSHENWINPTNNKYQRVEYFKLNEYENLSSRESKFFILVLFYFKNKGQY